MRTSEISRVKVRVSKQLLTTLPAAVSLAVQRARQDFGCASVTVVMVTPSYRFYAGEGERWFLFHGERSLAVEMAAEHNMGASDLHYGIGQTWTAEPGAFLLRIHYYGKFYATLFNVQHESLDTGGHYEV
jgi:hypothetical protein